MFAPRELLKTALLVGAASASIAAVATAIGTAVKPSQARRFRTRHTGAAMLPGRFGSVAPE